MTAQTVCLLLYISKNPLNFNGYNLLLFCLNIEIENLKWTFILYNRTVMSVWFACIQIECSSFHSSGMSHKKESEYD